MIVIVLATPTVRFWKKDKVELINPAQHKDRTLLTSFRMVDEGTTDTTKEDNWHVLNCHLQAGKQGMFKYCMKLYAKFISV